MPRAVGEVVLGPGTLYTAPVGTAYPADPSVAVAGFWTDIGYSDNGWVWKYDPKRERILVEEEFDPLLAPITTREIHLQGVSAQASLTVIQIAVGGVISTAVGPPATQTLTPVSTPDVDQHFALLLRAKAPIISGVQKYRDVQMYETQPVAVVEVAYRKAPNKTIVAQDWMILKPLAGGVPFKIVELQ